MQGHEGFHTMPSFPDATAMPLTPTPGALKVVRSSRATPADAMSLSPPSSWVSKL